MFSKISEGYKVPRIFSFLAFTMFATQLLYAGQTPPSSPPPSPRPDPQKMLSQCETLLQGSLQLVFPTPPTHPPVTQAHCAAATTASELVTTAVTRVFWTKGEEASPFLSAWRQVIIDTIGLCTYARVLARSQQPHEPLSEEKIDLLLQVFRQSEVFLNELCHKRSEIRKHSDVELKAPAIEAAQIVSEEWETPCHEFGGLAEKVIDWALCNHITPETMSRLIILALRVPKDGPISNSDAIRKRLLEQNLKQCEDLGTSVLNCALIVANASLKGLTLVAAKGAISTARLGRAQLGARILAEIEDDNSRAIPIAHRIAQAWAHKGAETEEQKRALRAELEATLTSFLKLPLADLSGIVTFVSDVIWDEQTRALPHLLFYHLPKMVKPSVGPPQSVKVCAASVRMADEIGILAHDVAAAYLWQDTDPNAHFRPIFLEIVQAAAKHIAYGILTSKGDCDPTENALRSARLLTMLHLFLEHHAAGRYEVQGFDQHDVEAPLVDLVHEILPHYLTSLKMATAPPEPARSSFVSQQTDFVYEYDYTESI